MGTRGIEKEAVIFTVTFQVKKDYKNSALNFTPEFSDFVFGYGDDEVEVDNPTGSQVSVNKPTVNVTIDLESISLNKTELNLEKGASETLKVTFQPEATGKGKTVTWSSSDTKVVTVSKDGKVTAADVAVLVRRGVVAVQVESAVVLVLAVVAADVQHNAAGVVVAVVV